jgi:putative ABC transport system ATP-binding protein
VNDELIDIEDLRFGWPGAPLLLRCDRFRLCRGEHLFIRGPSGSGKSTLLNLLAGVLVPDAGRLSLMGEDVGALSASARDRLRADHIGFIFQQFNLVPYLGLAENVVLACQFSRRRTARATEKHGDVSAAAQALLQRLFVDEGLNPTTPVSRLSVGQQQRVAAARALIGDPAIVIADEPTSALDHDARSRFVELLFERAAASGATLVFVSHDPTLAGSFERTADIGDFRAEAPA